MDKIIVPVEKKSTLKLNGLNKESPAICIFELEQPETAKTNDIMILEIIKHDNCHIHITMGKMGDSLNSRNRGF